MNIHADCTVRRNHFTRFRLCLHASCSAETLEVGFYYPPYVLKDSVLFLPTTTSQYFYCYPKTRSSVSLGVYSTVFSYANNSYYINASSLGFYSQTHFHFSGYWNSSRGVHQYVTCPGFHTGFSTAALQTGPPTLSVRLILPERVIYCELFFLIMCEPCTRTAI